VLFSEAAGRTVWIAVALSVAGLGLLSTASLGAFKPHGGDLLVLGGAVAWAGHVVALGRFAPRHPTIPLAVAQMAAATAFHSLAALPGGVNVRGAASIVPLLVVTGVLGTGVAYTVQIVAQRELSPARTAVIISGESLVAALLSIVWIGERLALHQWAGAALILGAMVMSETGARRVDAPIPVGAPTQ
jgi:drug/metabolite transporter (DMT)-like permease